jgi:hypothetical protein
MSSGEMVREGGKGGLEAAARAGYAARGIVYLIIGGFAVRAAFAGGEAMGTKGAIETVFGSAFGTILLWVLVAALAGFAVWRLVQAFLDPDRLGSEAKGLAIRTALVGSALLHAALAIYAASLALGLGQNAGSGSGSGGMIAKAYEAGYGRWATYLASLIILAMGIAHIVKGVKAGFEKYMRIPQGTRRWLQPTCRFGLIARGVTFLVIAFLLFTGAARYSEGDTPGVDAALSTMAGWPFGWLLFAATALGLVAFGIYALAEARYRKIDV